MGNIVSKGTRAHQALCILAISLPFLTGMAEGQAGRPKAPSTTVSVGSLAAPTKAREHLERARAASVKGDEDGYERELAAALTIYPRFAEAYLLRASHELLLDRYFLAIDAAETAQRYDPLIHWATIIHAIACNQLKQFDEAAKLLEGLSPAETETWQADFEKTRAAVGTGDIAGALHWSERALNTVPEYRADDSVLLRGDALLLAHRWPEAVTEFQTYLHSPRPQAHRAEVLALLDRIPLLASRDSADLIASNPQ